MGTKMVKIYWVRNLSEENTTIYNDTKIFEDKIGFQESVKTFSKYKLIRDDAN